MPRRPQDVDISGFESATTLEMLPNDRHFKCHLLTKSHALPTRGEGVLTKVQERRRILGALHRVDRCLVISLREMVMQREYILSVTVTSQMNLFVAVGGIEDKSTFPS